MLPQDWKTFPEGERWKKHENNLFCLMRRVARWPHMKVLSPLSFFFHARKGKNPFEQFHLLSPLEGYLASFSNSISLLCFQLRIVEKGISWFTKRARAYLGGGNHFVWDDLRVRTTRTFTMTGTFSCTNLVETSPEGSPPCKIISTPRKACFEIGIYIAFSTRNFSGFNYLRGREEKLN